MLQTSVLLIFMTVCCVKLGEPVRAIATLFIIHYVLLVATGIAYSLFLRYTRPNNTYNCRVGGACYCVWAALGVTILGLGLLNFLLGDNLQRRQVLKKPRRTSSSVPEVQEDTTYLASFYQHSQDANALAIMRQRSPKPPSTQNGETSDDETSKII